MLKITFLDKGALPETIFWKKNFFRRPQCHHEWIEFSYTPQEQVVERALGSDIIITNKAVLTREILQALPSLKLIAVTATGMNNIDVDAAKALGIAVRNVPAYSTQSVAEHVIAMIFALKHRCGGLNLGHYRFRGHWAGSRALGECHRHEDPVC